MSREVPPGIIVAVPVRASALAQAQAGGDTLDLANAVWDFVDRAFAAEYRAGELPAEAVWAHDLFVYQGEVMNGGHAQFACNRGGQARIFHSLLRGLAALGLEQERAIFADLIAFRSRHPLRYRRNHGGADAIDPAFYELDDRFGALPAWRINAALGTWLLDRAWIMPVANDAFTSLRSTLVPPHPLQDQRRDRRQSFVQEQLAAVLARFRPNA